MNRLLLTVTEAAEMAAVSRSQAYLLIRSGEWPSVLVGRRLKVPYRPLQRWIDLKTRNGPIGWPEPSDDHVTLDNDDQGGLRVTRRFR